MVALVDKVKIVTFNKHGLNLGLETLNKLFNNYDIICVQELWVRPNELHCVQIFIMNLIAQLCRLNGIMKYCLVDLLEVWQYFGEKTYFSSIVLLGHDVNAKCIGICFDYDTGKLFG